MTFTVSKETRMSADNYPLATCRVCKEQCAAMKLVKYGVRHYAHPDCAMKKWGCAFFDRLTPWQCGHQFPYFAAEKAGCADALKARAALDRP